VGAGLPVSRLPVAGLLALAIVKLFKISLYLLMAAVFAQRFCPG